MGGFSFANMPGGVFDARNVDPTPSFVVPPLDDYMVIATAAEPKENSKGTGGFLEFTLEINQGKNSGLQYQKVTVPYRLNLFHTDERTVAMANSQLSALCHATGVITPTNTKDLLNRPFVATIGPQEKNTQYSNVFAVKDLQGNIPGKKGDAAIAATSVPQAPVPTAPSTPAWGPPVIQTAPVQQPPVQTTWQPPAPAQAPTWGAPATPAVPTAPAVPSKPPWEVSASPAIPSWPPKT
jgi:hypothetical protein